MSQRMKRRLIVVTGTIVVVLVVVLAVVSAATASKTVSVAQALEAQMQGTKIQVTGKVVDNSYSISADVLNFAIYDPDGDPKSQLKVSYDGGVAATFGNQVTAICTGTVDANGVLQCIELVTKCPSKYENATDALSVSQLLGYGSAIEGKPMKVMGSVKSGSLKPAGQGNRLVLVDATGAASGEIAVLYDGAIPDAISDESMLVITGTLTATGKIEATDIALSK
ncbi:MAG: cytochrome c maturation protein CcmE [Coriobacteriales bacterium]|jgi:cytochrome c-type biogenesis protein CcmE|nr:cytochrome c maturation protein CcmE [Coriobacteriales bacterium]